MDKRAIPQRLYFFQLAFVATLCLASVACSTQSLMDRRTPAWAKNLGVQRSSEPVADNKLNDTQRGAAAEKGPHRADSSFYAPGTGKLIGAPDSIAESSVEGGEIKLNFQNANLLEVVKVVLGDMLGATYVIDPRVQGAVTMQTSAPLTRADLIPTLELLLRMNQAALVLDGDIYRVMPIDNAVTGVRAPQLGDSALPLPRGYSVRVVPLKYVAAEEMAQILEPFIAGGNNLLRTDTKRNAIILAGSGDDMARLIETIRIFDVDRMRGMSVAMFTPDFVDAKTLGEELDTILTDPDYGLMAGLVRIVVIERLNGIMVITPRPEYLAQVRAWIERLDRDTGGSGRRLFFYRVQNAKATDLAETLNDLFNADKSDKTPRPELAPGLTPTSARSTPEDQDTQGSEPPAPKNNSPALGDGLAVNPDSEVRVIADEPNNALLILASAQEYRQIFSTLQRLDVVPMQVLIDVTIAEVTLNDQLKYGVEWFFQNNIHSNHGDGLGIGKLDLGTEGLSAWIPGFSYAIQSRSGDVKFILNMLAQESNVSVLSSPSLLVLNNQEASIQVGAEVPITTQQQQSTTTSDANILNSIEYRDTGVQLQVKPRVNAGGLVIMEVEQENSEASQTTATQDLTPQIKQRKVKSTVAVQSGDTIILGGLISENHQRAESGIPGLHKVPFLGPLFGTKDDNQDRTELLVLITPRAILDRTSALRVTEEFRRKLNSLIPLTQPGQGTEVLPAAVPAAGGKAAKPMPTTPPTSSTQSPASKIPDDASATQTGTPKAGSQDAVSLVCERIGPFEDATMLGDFRRSHSNIRFQELPTTLKEVTYAHQVITSRFPTREQAQAAADRLKAVGVRKPLVYREGPSGYAVSLGVFSNLQNARRMVAKADQLNISVELRPRKKAVEQHWVLALQGAGNAMKPQLPAGVSATPIPCPAQSI